MDFSLPALSLEGVVKTFKGVDGRTIRALDQLNYVLDGQAAVHGVAGPDGAGKSTLAALAAGIIRPDEGEIRVFGMEPNLNNHEFLDAVSYLPQQLGLYSELSVWDNLTIFAAIKDVPIKERDARFKDLLMMTGLSGFEDRAAGHLSGGMRQKLSLACALVGTPKLLILDEPTVGVDPISRNEIYKIIENRVKDKQMYCLMMTTLLSEAAQTESVLLLQEGKLLASGSPKKLVSEIQDRTFSLARHGNMLERRRFDRKMQQYVRAQDGTSPYLDVVPCGEYLNVLLASDADKTKLDPNLQSRPAKLEDAYCALTLPEQPTESEAESYAKVESTPDNFVYDPNAETIIETDHIMKCFGKFVAVADTSFKVGKGEIFGLLGPNGAGKTTTFRMMNGLSAPTKGNVYLEGKNLNKALSEMRMRIGYAAQKFSLYDLLSVEQNLLYFAQSYGLSGQKLQDALNRSFDELDLRQYKDTQAGHLPLGAKRSLTMAVALINSPDILFLDEPTSGADTAARREFWRRIARLSDKGTTTIVTTHFMEEAEYCDRILIQDAGQVLILGTPEEIRNENKVNGKPAATIEEAFDVVVENFRNKKKGEQV